MLYTLQDATFEDGTSLTGYADIQAVSISAWDISTSAFHYTPATSGAGIGTRSTQDISLAVFAANRTGDPAALDLWINAGPGDLASNPPELATFGMGYSAEFTEAGRRFVVSGCLVPFGGTATCEGAVLVSSIPEPSALVCMGLLIALMLATARRSSAI